MDNIIVIYKKDGKPAIKVQKVPEMAKDDYAIKHWLIEKIKRSEIVEVGNNEN